MPDEPQIPQYCATGVALFRLLRTVGHRASYLSVHGRFLDAVEQKRNDVVNSLVSASGEMTQAADSLNKVIAQASQLTDQKVTATALAANATYVQARNVTLATIVVALLATLT
nr:hypothetical protein [Tanacetum cinerariifolium]